MLLAFHAEAKLVALLGPHSLFQVSRSSFYSRLIRLTQIKSVVLSSKLPLYIRRCQSFLLNFASRQSIYYR